jgi:hypothetical protein
MFLRAVCSILAGKRRIAAFAWLAAFGGYAATYTPLLLLRPPAWQGRA